jgi:hypothetical protein
MRILKELNKVRLIEKLMLPENKIIYEIHGQVGIFNKRWKPICFGAHYPMRVGYTYFTDFAIAEGLFNYCATSKFSTKHFHWKNGIVN